MEHLVLVRSSDLSLILLSSPLRSPFWNPAALPLLEPCLSVPLSLRYWLRLWLIAVDLLRSNLDLGWSNQLDPASFTRRRRHVSCIEPVVVVVLDRPINLRPLALFELADKFLGCDVLRETKMRGFRLE